jgi:hypothetical protein
MTSPRDLYVLNAVFAKARQDVAFDIPLGVPVFVAGLRGDYDEVSLRNMASETALRTTGQGWQLCGICGKVDSARTGLVTK